MLLYMDKMCIRPEVDSVSSHNPHRTSSICGTIVVPHPSPLYTLTCSVHLFITVPYIYQHLTQALCYLNPIRLLLTVREKNYNLKHGVFYLMECKIL